MELQISQVSKAAVDELRILATRTGSVMLLFDESDKERDTGLSGPQGEIANYTGAVYTAAQHEHIEGRLPEASDLLGARVRHSQTSLEDAAQKTYRA